MGVFSNTAQENIMCNHHRQQSGNQYTASISDHALWPKNSTSRNITAALFTTVWKVGRVWITQQQGNGLK